ncbi:MAG TPA: ribonuclease HI family protein [Candidatus Paceibacterota bacterium]|nr:ribonuclease HI family protein [Candidatus Paceibacterota bacterium]
MSADGYIIFADGGARGNPGPAAYGFVLRGADIAEFAYGKAIGKATNNVAEYTAAIEALKKLKSLIGAERAAAASVQVNADSELLVKQMNREYRVKDPDLQRMYMELHNVMMDFRAVAFVHVRREQNKLADHMVNDALDREQATLEL